MRPIGFFDSGIGGLSVLSTAQKMLPNEDFVYYGDNARAPYGELPPEKIAQYTIECIEKLVDMDMKALVIACNTATSVAIVKLREWLDIPIISMEPAIKPAFEMKKNGLVAVMATPATLKQPRFIKLRRRIDPKNEALLLPCPNLVELIEKGEFDSQEIDEYILNLFLPHTEKKIDCIVLGCTHFVIIKKTIERVCNKLFDQPKIVHGNQGTVKRLTNILKQNNMLNQTNENGSIKFFSSKDVSFLKRVFSQIQ